MYGSKILKDKIPVEEMFTNRDRDNILTAMTYFPQIVKFLAETHTYMDGYHIYKLPPEIQKLITDLLDLNEQIQDRIKATKH